MPFIAVLGCGPLAGALAHALAVRDRVPEVRLVDPAESVARGKALDIMQSAPVDGFSARVTSAGPIEAAAGADAIVLADAADGGEHRGETGLALLRRLRAIDGRAPIVCAGAGQRELIARGVTDARIPPAGILGSAPLALESALRALAGLTLDRSGAEVGLRVVGVPPDAAVIAWEESCAGGEPLTAQVAPHVLAGLSARVRGLWPPGPYALGAAAARIVEALVNGTRRRYTCFVATRGGPVRAAVVAMPVELERGGVRRIVEPTLTRQERTLLENALES